jgi:hypothetical protein
MSLCSQSSTIQIHEKNIVEIAKNVIKMPGWKCEWGSSSTVSDSDCRVVLVSWNAYLQVSYLFPLLYHNIWHIKTTCTAYWLRKSLIIYSDQSGFWDLEVVISLSYFDFFFTISIPLACISFFFP